MAQQETNPSQGIVTEQRISRLTLVLGVLAGVLTGLLRARIWGAGIIIGSVLAWLNFRWLRRGLDALVQASIAQTGHEKPQVPLTTHFFAVFRYGLIAVSVYVIFIYLHVPLLSMVAGLCALGAAAIAASVYEILHPME
jgi:small-conductance mechanosensitive channel